MRKFFAGFAVIAMVLSAQEKKAAPKMTDAQKIALALGAAPAEIAKHAAVMDMTDMSAPPKQLRAGTNDWACFAMIDAPMCADKEWQKFMEAMMTKKPPQISSNGIAYMLRGDKGASNTDPYATGPAPGNQWVISPAHVMLLFQDPKMIDTCPTDPTTGGPWVMWKGTPYAHVMVPVAPTQMAKVPGK